MSLSLLNLARIEHRMKYPTDNEGFSMASLKRSYTNELLLNLFLSKLEFDPNNEKINRFIRNSEITALLRLKFV